MTLRPASHLRILQADDTAATLMADEAALGRTVEARERFARIFALGDRKKPSARTPALVLVDGDSEMDPRIAPFHLTRDPTTVPATLKFRTRGKLCPPFERETVWEASEGLSLPPTLDESDGGTLPSGEAFLPVSLQSISHDPRLADLDVEPSVICLIDAPQLANDDLRMIGAIDALRRRFPSSLIWAPGIAGPDNCALLAWMGVDLMDLSRSRRAHSSGVLLSAFGPRMRDPDIDHGDSWDHQISIWKDALAETRMAIREGSIRQLAEAVSLSSPRSVQKMRRHDAHVSEVAINDPGQAGLASASEPGRVWDCSSRTSRDDPMIRYWHHSIGSRWVPMPHQSGIAVLLPCSATKPYRRSPSHRKFRDAIASRAVSEIMVTAPLGLVPRELEVLWPASSYDIPVTGEWDMDELQIIRKMASDVISRTGFDTVINHSGVDLMIDGCDVIDTRMGDTAGSQESLKRLSEEVQSATKGANALEPKRGVALLESFRSISRHLYEGDAWLDGAKVSGRAPNYRITLEGDQIAVWDSSKGRFAFSKSVLPILLENNTLPLVNLVEGHTWTGDLFTSNVAGFTGSPRIGDEILVLQAGALRGSARAVAPSWEWPAAPGALARARHRL
jgi:archaeosine synthase